MKIIAIIPARMGSSRFPGKPMAKIHGMPMIGHCYYRASFCPDLIETYVATCDQEIYDYIESIGGNAVMTSDLHERASDRTAEAMLKIEKQLKYKVDIVVMIQGDEPMVTPDMISASIDPFKSDEDLKVVNLMANLDTVDEFIDPNEVKVVVDNQNYAIYFSREPIPSIKKYDEEISMMKQVCIIPFRRDYLLHFNKTQETKLEIIESIDMLRVIESGDKVKMIPTTENTLSVDTKEELQKVEFKMSYDSLMQKYL